MIFNLRRAICFRYFALPADRDIAAECNGNAMGDEKSEICARRVTILLQMGCGGLKVKSAIDRILTSSGLCYPRSRKMGGGKQETNVVRVK